MNRVSLSNQLLDFLWEGTSFLKEIHDLHWVFKFVENQILIVIRFLFTVSKNTKCGFVADKEEEDPFMVVEVYRFGIIRDGRRLEFVERDYGEGLRRRRSGGSRRRIKLIVVFVSVSMICLVD